MIEKLQFYFQYPFVWYALIVGVLIALCSSLLGVTLVLKRFSYIGDGLSHVAFGAMAVASVMKLSNNMYLILPVTVVCAVLLLRTGQNTKIKGDAAIAMISVSSLAIGYLLMNVFSTGPNVSGDVCSTLFGSTSILTLTIGQVRLCAVLSVVVVVTFVMFYNKIFSVTFDETFAKATGMNTNLYNTLLAILIAVVIVLAMNLVGSLLISALVIFPALSAMRIFRNFRSVTICSVGISVVCACVGIFVSILAGTPVGSTIVMMDMIAFLLACGIGHARGKAGIHKLPYAACLVLMLGLLSGCGDNNRTNLIVTTESVIPEQSTEQVTTEEKRETTATTEQGTTEATTETAATMEETSGTETAISTETGSQTETGVDYDLTTMSKSMVYATVYQLMIDPDSYRGKTFRIMGDYYASYYEPTAKYYHYCVIQDATACCAQGLEFVWGDGSHVYPDEYPAENTSVVVQGVFETYTEDDNPQVQYCRLVNATIELGTKVE